MQTKPILVIGATGKTGSRVAAKLEAKGHPVRRGSRNSATPFDWEAPETWSQALSGARAAYVTYFPDLAFPGAVEKLESLVETAKDVGVEHLVLLSGRGEHHARQGEQVMRESGVDHTIVRAAWFAQNFSEGYLRDPILAGVLLAESEFRRELETDIEPFKGLLLGLFFIAVGMSIDFGAMLRAPLVVALLLTGFVAIKGVVIYALARAVKIPYQERPVFTLLLAQGGEFAFVVFQAAAGAGALPGDMASLLIGAVALSMLCTPLLLVLLDRFVLPRYAATLRTPPEGEISEPQTAPVLIAGFGRYGQIVARVLLAQGIPATVLDHSVDILEVARTFGYRVFYGDATRLDLLRTAGAAQARVLVLAVDAPSASLKIAALAREHFPHLKIVARARDLTHWNELRDLGVEQVQREVFESSLVSARSVLQHMGLEAAETDALLARFRQHNIALADRMYPHHKDQARMIAVAREGRSQLAEQLAKEREERSLRSAQGTGYPGYGEDGGAMNPEDEQPLKTSSKIGL